MAYRERVNMERAAEMRSMYKDDPTLSVNELSDVYNISKSSAYRITRMTDDEFESYKNRSNGINERNNATRKTTVRRTVPTDLKECPTCHSPITNKGARFCWRCGSDVRSDETKAAEGLRAILGAHYSLSDTHSDAIRSAIKLLGIDIDNM